MLNGYDIDGVLTAGVKPQQPYVVISGREEDPDDRYVAQLRKSAQVFLRPSSDPHTDENIGMFKSIICTIMGVTHFYENNPVQADIIRENTGIEVTLITR